MRLRFWLLGLLFGFGWPGVVAQAAAAHEEFARGVTAFRDGDFEAAERFFGQAREAGLDTAALYFNLGSTLYKLGRYAEAQQAFALCAHDPAWTALCRYNIGLTLWQQGDRAAAAGHFSWAWRQTEDRKIAALSLAMLQRVDPMARWVPRSQVGISLGYDSNVVLYDQALSASSSGKSDLYTELVASAGAHLGSGNIAPLWQVSLYDLRYFDLTDYSISQFQLGMDFPWRLGSWTSAAGGQWRYLWLDGNAFQQIGTLRAFSEYSFSRDTAVQVNVRYEQIDSLDNNYLYLEGQRLEAGTWMTQPVARGWISYGLTYDHNNRNDLNTGTDFYSYSPDRYALWWRGSWPLGSRWRLEPSVRYRTSRYADDDRHGGITQVREDKEWLAGFLVRWRLTGTWRLTGEYIYTSSRSNYSEFSYTRHQVQLGVLRPF